MPDRLEVPAEVGTAEDQCRRVDVRMKRNAWSVSQRGIDRDGDVMIRIVDQAER